MGQVNNPTNQARLGAVGWIAFRRHNLKTHGVICVLPITLRTRLIFQGRVMIATLHYQSGLITFVITCSARTEEDKPAEYSSLQFHPTIRLQPI